MMPRLPGRMNRSELIGILIFASLRVKIAHSSVAISGDGEQMGACRSTKYRPIGAKYALIPLLGRSVLVPTCVGDD